MSRPAIFLDRDGTIIVERDYLADPDGVELETNAAEGLRRLAGQGWPLVVVTNQSGIGRGYFDRAAAEAVNARVGEYLAAEGVEIAGWYLCPHGPEDVCDCRKPAPGMLLEAARDLDLDPARSFMVGDKRADLGAAKAAGARGILVTTGHGGEEAGKVTDGSPIVADLLAAAILIESLVARD
ncbi:HAD family hydrolase [Sphingomonas naphthae]|uniref:D,D-heptose 1,7-bisphosphate phosphatase n=1 Tax=Sphingomonas naphthae TaxID=1813468 RepID=A0ABY7TRC4_9SPHN|nr:HAD family hydrolase [Sphingomonas naphthae]WCT75192.1 HAD family hydrolase [Sphingomonas naphthae]